MKILESFNSMLGQQDSGSLEGIHYGSGRKDSIVVSNFLIFTVDLSSLLANSCDAWIGKRNNYCIGKPTNKPPRHGLGHACTKVYV